MNFNLTGNRGSARPSFASVGAAKQYGSPPEDVCATVYLNQIVHVDLPFNTARASAIRQYCGSFLVDDRGRRLLIFRKETNGWTNIHHDSTALETKRVVRICSVNKYKNEHVSGKRTNTFVTMLKCARSSCKRSFVRGKYVKDNPFLLTGIGNVACWFVRV